MMRPLPTSSLTTLGLALALTAIGCDDGGGPRSGVDRSKYLDELNADEVQQLCAWSTSQLEPGEHTCPGGGTAKGKTTSECVEDYQKPDKPHCLVSLTEDCVNSLGGDLCKMFDTHACQTYVHCVATN